MAYGTCNRCGAGISWDKQKREQLNTRLPLNYDGTIHTCGIAGNGKHLPAQAQQRPTNPIQKAVIDQDQKSKDIKDAQAERKKQHIEFIKNLQWNTKMMAHLNETSGGGKAEDILDAIGFEEYREDQLSGEEMM